MGFFDRRYGLTSSKGIVAIGVLLMAILLILVWRASQNPSGYMITPGTVEQSNLVSQTSTGAIYEVGVKYTVSGKDYFVQGKVGSDKAGVGNAVDVYYDPAHPMNGQLAKHSLSTNFLILGLLGLAVLWLINRFVTLPIYAGLMGR